MRTVVKKLQTLHVDSWPVEYFVFSFPCACFAFAVIRRLSKYDRDIRIEVTRVTLTCYINGWFTAIVYSGLDNLGFFIHRFFLSFSNV